MYDSSKQRNELIECYVCGDTVSDNCLKLRKPIFLTCSVHRNEDVIKKLSKKEIKKRKNLNEPSYFFGELKQKIMKIEPSVSIEKTENTKCTPRKKASAVVNTILQHLVQNVIPRRGKDEVFHAFEKFDYFKPMTKHKKKQFMEYFNATTEQLANDHKLQSLGAIFTPTEIFQFIYSERFEL